MRICYVLDNYDRASGGAALAARGLAHYLADLGHQVSILQPGKPADYSDGSIAVHSRRLRRPYLYRQHDRDTLGWNRQWRHIVDDFLDANPTDLLITQNRLLYSSIEAAAARNIPTVIWAHAYRLFCPDQFFTRDPITECNGNCRECLSGIFGHAARENHQAYQHGMKRASLIIANSEYMARVVKHHTGRDAPVVYPTFDLDDWRQPGAEQREHVLFIKPQERKGFRIFLEIASALPERRFIVAGKTSNAVRRDLSALANVSTIDWSNEMREVYARTEILLGPSIWPEPFGRVFVEAAGAGVPSITSNRGGIPEAVGSGGILIDDIHNIHSWIDAIGSLDDPKTRQTLSTRAREHAGIFSSAIVGAELRDAVLAETGLDLHTGATRN
jgi:glycosyltransferase involved in cell wall biosynthesis